MTGAELDRQKSTPFLLRLFHRQGGFHPINDFQAYSQPTADEVETHTWKDATLYELTTVLAQSHPTVAQPGTRCAFRLIYADTVRGRFQVKELGTVQVGGEKTGSAAMTLDEARFVVGDWIDVAVFSAGHHGLPEARGMSFAGGRGGGPSFRGGRGGFNGGAGGPPRGEWKRGDDRDTSYGRGDMGRGGRGRW
ncbi:hypothetical protein G7K_4659-t1 [Saitoella complicata NRRL Y-17804]|uniref:Sin3 associated polypeptide p18 n=1 Tax=Saitoella complicata (strain BCRC 22490 / CBS 7301 / JCM 7358 / NBRC 10748 / NRRL Y-17804) TaxID=698492 RepID=A0A0E9NM90_SAICN|nr:hypothetical protein G7K_4659-t1 [Saitoella complicata NRRL Y-17804]